jgi:hypothetical protein
LALQPSHFLFFVTFIRVFVVTKQFSETTCLFCQVN